mmetsp:Transcript_17506/g.26482  ORF Transcript_17506/g.26482 Transcript_17506/m.26482 type:complete len:359 (-) Transcript_17506:2707-3783(-)
MSTKNIHIIRSRTAIRSNTMPSQNIIHDMSTKLNLDITHTTAITFTFTFRKSISIRVVSTSIQHNCSTLNHSFLKSSTTISQGPFEPHLFQLKNSFGVHISTPISPSLLHDPISNPIKPLALKILGHIAISKLLCVHFELIVPFLPWQLERRTQIPLEPQRIQQLNLFGSQIVIHSPLTHLAMIGAVCSDEIVQFALILVNGTGSIYLPGIDVGSGNVAMTEFFLEEFETVVVCHPYTTYFGMFLFLLGRGEITITAFDVFIVRFGHIHIATSTDTDHSIIAGLLPLALPPTYYHTQQFFPFGFFLLQHFTTFGLGLFQLFRCLFPYFTHTFFEVFLEFGDLGCEFLLFFLVFGLFVV